MEKTDDTLRSAPPATLDVPVCRALDSHIELRADEDTDAGNGEPNSPGTLVGNFSVFDSWYEINSWFEGNFIERLAPGAFKRTIKNRSDETPIRVLLEHGFDPTVGDKPLGVPRTLEERDEGPYAEVPLFDTSYNRDLAPALRAGAYGQSFRFQVLRDEWVEEPDPSEHNPKGIPERTIKEVRLIEFGPTVFPASPATNATTGLRSTTDEFYEKLRRRDQAAYDAAVARSAELRLPKTPPRPDDAADSNTEDPQRGHSEDPQPSKAEPTPAPVERQHSEDSPSTHSKATNTPAPVRKETVMDPMTVEERTARQSEIRARLSEIDTEYQGNALPEDVQTEWDDLRTEFAEHDEAIEAQVRRQQEIAQIAARTEGEQSRSTRVTPEVIRRPENIYDLTALRQQARSVDELPRLYRDAAMRAVEVAKFPGAKDRTAAQGHVERLLDSVDDEAGTLARRILTTGSPVYDRAFGKAAKALSVNGLNAEEARALSLGTDAEGGYAVPFDLDPTVMLTSDGVIDPLRAISRVEQIMGKEWQGITSAGITVTRKAEKAESTDDSPSVDQPTCKTSRVDGFVQFSVEIDADWQRMRSELTRLLADAKATEEADSFVNGDGTANAAGVEPEGILTGVTATVALAAAGALDSDDLYNLEEAVPPRFRAAARFLATRSFYNTVRGLGSDSDGGNLWVRLADGLPPELIGYPAHEASEMPAPALNSDTGVLAVLGDFRQFLIVDRVGMNVELVPHIFGTNRRPTGQRGIWAYWRNGSKVLVPGAFRKLVGNDGVV